MYLLVHVNDILTATKSLEKLMSQVGKNLEIKNLCQAKNLLSINDSQSDILEVTEAKFSRTPMDIGYHQLPKAPLKSNEEYRKIVGMML